MMTIRTFKFFHHKIYHLVVVCLQAFAVVHLVDDLVQDGQEDIHYNPVDHHIECEKENWTQHSISTGEFVIAELAEQQPNNRCCRLEVVLIVVKLTPEHHVPEDDARYDDHAEHDTEVGKWHAGPF